MKRNVLAISSIFTACSLALGGLAHAEPLFKYKGQTYATENLNAKQKGLLYEFDTELFKKKEQLADEIVLEEYLKEEAGKKKKSVEDVRKELVEAKDPSEAEIKKFYEENKARIPYPLDQIKADLVRFLKQQKTAEKQTALLAKLKKDGKFEMAIKEPVAPVVDVKADGFAHRGNDKAKVTVVEFADFKCGHCGEAAKAFKQLYKKYDSKVSFYFVDFPLIGPLSEKIAEGAACAREAGKYWEYNELAYEKQAELKDDSPKELAAKVGADAKKFDECMAKGRGQAVVKKGRAEGERIGVSGTPTIFINGKKFLGAPSVDGLSSEIEKALKAAGAS